MENILNKNNLALACRVMYKLCLLNLIVRNLRAEINNANDNRVKMKQVRLARNIRAQKRLLISKEEQLRGFGKNYFEL